ncbi:MAG TPA: ABC transporter permease [Blastocatellia bacterium]|nr:ABC transporter permease [Blastocatellia bacterium]
MKKVLIIIKREYLVRVRTRAFMIGTIISPLLMIALIALPIFFATRGGGDRRVTVLDQSGDPELFDAIKRSLDARGSGEEELNRRDPGVGTTRYVLTRKLVAPGEDLDALQQQYAVQADKDPDSTYMILRPGGLEKFEPEYFAKNTSDFSIGTLERAINDAVSGLRLKRAGLDQATINLYTRRVELNRKKVTSGGGVEEGGRADFVVAFVMLFFIYMSVLIYGLFVMRGVIEEKQSRIVEVLVSSVRPTQMMLGKVIGIGLVGLTQIAVWALSALLLTTVGVSVFASRGMTMPNIPISLLIYFVVFFVLGYFLFATLYALVGSTVSSEEEAQQAQIPVTMLLIVPMVIFNMIIANPTSTASIVLSMIPFFAPTLMMMRIAVVNPPFWQILLSMGIMVATILLCVWIAARIYRVGILMYGKRPSIAELGRWLRYS